MDRRAFVDMEVRTKLAVQSAKELTEPRDVKLRKENGETALSVRVPVRRPSL